MLKVGIIGFGKMGMLHGALLNGTNEARVVAICDKSFVMRFGFKKVYPNVNAYDDLDKMLKKEQLDIVVVATPSFNHIDSAIKCALKGCNLFIEKPLATSYNDISKLSNIILKNKEVKVQVGFASHFVPTFYALKKLVETKRIAEIKSVEAQMFIGDVFEKHSGWRYNKLISGGGALMDFGIHMIELLIWYFGEIDEVRGSARKIYSEEVEDEFFATIIFKSGIECNFETSWSKDEYRKSYSYIKMNSDKGEIIATDQTLDIYEAGILKENFTYPDLYSGAYMDIGGIQFSRQIYSFLSLIKNGAQEGTNLEQATYAQKIIEKLYESAEKAAPVKIEE